MRQPRRTRRAARQRQLPVDPQGQQHLQHRQAERDGRQHGLEHDRVQPGPPEQAGRDVRGVQPAGHIQRQCHPGGEQADTCQAHHDGSAASAGRAPGPGHA